MKTLLTLASTPSGAAKLNEITDMSPLIEIASSHSMVLDIFFYSWLNLMPAKLLESETSKSETSFPEKISKTLSALVNSFVGTDGVTLLQFVGLLLRNLDERLIPGYGTAEPPQWFDQIVSFCHSLVASRPNPTARSAYTICLASLLQTYPSGANAIFTNQPQSKSSWADSEKPLNYLLLNLLLIDIRATVPTLLSTLNEASFPLDALRIASALDIIPAWMKCVLGSMDTKDEADISLPMPADLILKLRTSLTDALSECIEYVRDRWDASTSGVPGLDPSAREGKAELFGGASHMTLTWESKHVSANDDPVILSAIRAIAAWVLEDDESSLKKELRGLVDVIVDLYAESCKHLPSRRTAAQAQYSLFQAQDTETKTSHENIASHFATREIRGTLDFRPAVLSAIEALISDEKGLSRLLNTGIVQLLENDMNHVLDLAVEAIESRFSASSPSPERVQYLFDELAHGAHISATLLYLLDEMQERGKPIPKAWLDFVTKFAGWGGVGTDIESGIVTKLSREFQGLGLKRALDGLEISAKLLDGSPPGVQRRYVHTRAALSGISRWVIQQIDRNIDQVEQGVGDRARAVLVSWGTL